MLVSVTGFGSLWRHRLSKDQNDWRRFARGVYYNTTGVHVAGATRQRPKIVGYARFHQCSGFDPHHPSRMVGRVFDCAEPCVWQGDNKLLFQHLLRRPEFPERFLVVTRPELTGRLRIRAGWRSPDTWLISFSECNEDQEAMLLMSVESWIETDVGRFFLVTPDRDRPWLARLILNNTLAGVSACGI